MFRETLDYRETLIRTLGFTDSRAVAPHAEVLAAKDETGLRWSYDPDGCCEIRKVEPMNSAQEGLDALVSGRQEFPSVTRTILTRFLVTDRTLKINQLAALSPDDLDDRVEADVRGWWRGRVGHEV